MSTRPNPPCGPPPERRILSSIAWAALLASPAAALQSDLVGTWPVPATPAGNPSSSAVEDLGKLLFWDEQLSSDNTMACGTCHDFGVGGADGRATSAHPDTLAQGSFGVRSQDVNREFVTDPDFGTDRRVTEMTTPTVIGSAFFEKLFWDRRADQSFEDEGGTTLPGFEQNAALETQAAIPVVSETEMAHAGITWADASAKLAGTTPLRLAASVPPSLSGYLGSSYDTLFAQAFGAASPNVNRERVAMALASYQRTLVPDAAPIDVPLSLNSLERRGFVHFTARATKSQFARTCASCHSANLFGGFAFSGTAFEDPNDNLFSDGLRHAIGLANTGSPLDGVPFKTPTLRNVGTRTRFMHDGRMGSLSEVLDFYNGDTTHGDAKFGFAVPLDANEMLELEAFLLALTDARIAAGTPPFDRPVLRSELEPFESNLYGDTTPPFPAGAPHILASDPPLTYSGVDNPWFRIGVGNAGGPIAAFLMLASASTAGVPFQGVTAYVDPTASDFTVLQVQLTDPNTGTHALTGWLDDAALVGVPFYAQWLLIGSGGRTASEAAAFTRF